MIKKTFLTKDKNSPPKDKEENAEEGSIKE
jgi:hypothetical protein